MVNYINHVLDKMEHDNRNKPSIDLLSKTWERFVLINGIMKNVSKYSKDPVQNKSILYTFTID